MREVSESLAGRAVLLNLPGLNVREIQAAGWDGSAPGAQLKLLTRGWFPELWADPSIPSREFYQAYVATYLERDLRQMVNVGSLRGFERYPEWSLWFYPALSG